MYMRIEIPLFIAAAVVIGNIYTDGKVLKKIMDWKKYFQMGGVLVVFFMLYYLIRKNPNDTDQILLHSHEYLKYLPLDKNSNDILRPILDFSSKYSGGNRPIINVPMTNANERRTQIGGTPRVFTKRAVSESKKKFVSARQGWKCHHCKQQLSAFYEVDHVVPLYKGGSNDVNNLVSLCRECHAKKTAMDRYSEDSIL